MNKKWGFVAGLALLAVAALAAHDTKADVRYTDLAAMENSGVKGSAVLITLPNNDLEVWLRLEGLKPGSGSYANHIHFNDGGDANCKAQNGNKILGLKDAMAGADGTALVYTRIPAANVAAYPKGTTYVNLHANSPQPVGGSISCGDVLVIKLGQR
jgi:Cu-Zn family superoxide dismutase